MKLGLLIDNWTLQDAGTLVSGGLTGKRSADINTAAQSENELYAYVSADALRLAALFQMLNDVVFADELFVDAEFTKGWSQVKLLDPVIQGRLVVSKPLKQARNEWLPIREAIVERLCVSDVMRERQHKNVSSWPVRRDEYDGFFGQVVWGGAGMLARADFLNLPYSAHPSRARLLRQVGYLPPSNARRRLDAFVDEQRVKIFGALDADGVLGSIILPPVAVQIISEASDADDLFEVATQLRNDYTKIRRWLAEFQHVLDVEDTARITKRQKLLQTIARDLNNESGKDAAGAASIQFDFGLLQISVDPGVLTKAVRMRFGVRPQIKRLILAQSGRRAFRKLLKMFGEQRSKLGREVEDEFFRH